MVLMLILIPLGIAAALFTFLVIRRCVAEDSKAPRVAAIVLGAVTNFFDTLGIGSFAPTMAWMKLQRLVPDRLIPLTMVAGHSLPTLAQSAIFLVLLGVQVDPILLVTCVMAMAIGGQIGVPLARHASIRFVQGMVAAALLVAAGFYVSTNLGIAPQFGKSGDLVTNWPIAAIALHLLLGILLNFGVGNYAPTLLFFSLAGIDPKLAFPVMSSACAYCMITSGLRSVGEKSLDVRMITGMALGGVPAVLVAAFVVKTMPLAVLRWLVVAVVLFASAILWRSALRRGGGSREAAEESTYY